MSKTKSDLEQALPALLMEVASEAVRRSRMAVSANTAAEGAVKHTLSLLDAGAVETYVQMSEAHAQRTRERLDTAEDAVNEALRQMGVDPSDWDQTLGGVEAAAKGLMTMTAEEWGDPPDEGTLAEYVFRLKADLDALRQRAERQDAALAAIAEWTMHSGVDAYAQHEDYSGRYYLLEREVMRAREIAQAARQGQPSPRDLWGTTLAEKYQGLAIVHHIRAHPLGLWEHCEEGICRDARATLAALGAGPDAGAERSG